MATKKEKAMAKRSAEEERELRLDEYEVNLGLRRRLDDVRILAEGLRESLCAGGDVGREEVVSVEQILRIAKGE